MISSVLKKTCWITTVVTTIPAYSAFVVVVLPAVGKYQIIATVAQGVLYSVICKYMPKTFWTHKVKFAIAILVIPPCATLLAGPITTYSSLYALRQSMITHWIAVCIASVTTLRLMTHCVGSV